MTIIIKDLTLRNFLSIGAVTQAVSFNRTDLTLILGENLDMGGDGARNGTGKSALLQAISYALFGIPINSIRKDNLVNRTNGKAMLVTLSFTTNGIEYTIERGRKPNILRFKINGKEQTDKEDDSAQGENKFTQAAIEKTIHMSADMFKHIVALNTYSEPFLAMRSNDQRIIIEQLLGITILSEKAETIKSMIGVSKDAIKAEEFRVKAVDEANKRIVEQIDSLKRRQMLWTKKHETDVIALFDEYEKLSHIDITAELLNHKELATYNSCKAINDSYYALIARQTGWITKRDREVQLLTTTYEKLNKIDIAQELRNHTLVAEYNTRVRDKAAQDLEFKRASNDVIRYTTEIKKITDEITQLNEHKCYACGQDLHDKQHETVLGSKQKALDTAEDSLAKVNAAINEIETNRVVLGKMPSTIYKTEAEAIKHSGELERIVKQIDDKKNEADPYIEQIVEQAPLVTVLSSPPTTIYETEAEAVTHQATVDNLLAQMTSKEADVDPYAEQIVDMEQKALQVVNFDVINTLTRTMDHQKFLLDMLTNKDSFVRKRIIDQNLVFLNKRLTHYLETLGLPHQVVFKNDLTVEITELGRELDYGNLSRGEANRVILSLSFAFRDVWENLYQPVNLLFIDELLDSGMDTAGAENTLHILKDMARQRKKSIWLISHKDELVSRVGNILQVVKENGFTGYNTSVETEA